MKNLLYLLCFLFAGFTGNVFSQDKKERPKIEIGGFIRYDLFIDTYASVDSREGEFYLYPKRQQFDSLGNDINKNLQLEMLSLLSRFNLKTNTMTILGAETYGFIEADFLGTSQAYSRLLRLRHAYMSLTWSNKSQLLLGQYWHPMFLPEISPQAVTWAVGLPFTAFNRSPQARFTYWLNESINVLGAISGQGYHNSLPNFYSDPTIKNNPQRDAFIPDMQLRVQLQKSKLLISLHGGYKFLKPRLITEAGIKTDKMIGSYNFALYSKLNTSILDLKGGAVYGEDLRHLVMIGGYGAKQNPELVDDYDYGTLKTVAAWIELSPALKRNSLTLFGGFSQILGSDTDYYPLGYSRSEDLNYVYAIAPRYILEFDRLKIRFEYRYTVAVYGNDFNNNGRVVSSDKPVTNSRIISSILYKF